MTRYFALVLVPGDTPEDEASDAALELLSPFMQDARDPTADFKFDYSPPLTRCRPQRRGEPPRRLADRRDRRSPAELEIEAILTPNAEWYETGTGELWDDDALLAWASRILRQFPQDYLALRHVLHI